MNIQELAAYVEQEVDDNFATDQISRWFNKGIANYNLIPPLTTYPYISIGAYEDLDNGVYNETSQYPLPNTFVLGVMLPFIASSVRSAESSLSEKQLLLQEYMQNAKVFKHSIDVPLTYLVNQKNTDLSQYEIGEGVYLSNFENSPFAGSWGEITNIGEIVYPDEE